MDKVFELKHFNSSKEFQLPIVTIGYYPIRGKAQVPRLLCQYLGVPYEDQLFSLAEWDKFKKKQAHKWDFPDLPFLQEGNFILTEAFPISQYIIDRFGPKSLLGQNQKDKGTVQMYVWSISTMNSIININCTGKAGEQFQRFKEKQWRTCVLPQLLKYQEGIMADGYFLDYLTIIDFSIYELMRYMQMLFPKQIEKNLPRLTKIKQLVYNIPQISSYEGSNRAIKEMDPIILKSKFNSTKK